VHHLRRREWRRFKSLLSVLPETARCPAFGDYGTLHPLYEEPQDGCRPSASVRYAVEDEWLVLRGYSIRDKKAGGMGQFRGHAQYLSRLPEFSGSAFSPGDAYISARAKRGATTGNLTTWLSASMNHHLTLTSSSLAALSQAHVAVVADRPRVPSQPARP